MTSTEPIFYGKQTISEEDIQTVCDVLRSDWLTTGPVVSRFEKKVAEYCNAGYGVAVNSGTAALHAAMHAIGLGPGDEVIVPAMTFAATASAVVYQKGIPVFADVDPDTLLIDTGQVKDKITSRTRAIIAVDYAGQMCSYNVLKQIADDNNLYLVSDACHSLGAAYNNQPSGSCADLTVFSFHPVKHITTGEGGMIVTDDKNLARKMACFRNHGINRDASRRQAMDSWFYEIEQLGFNYRLTDFQCALGLSQLKNLNAWIEKRNRIAAQYDSFFKHLPYVQPLKKQKKIKHAYHLYVIKMAFDQMKKNKKEIFSAMKQMGIFLNVHYIPVHLHPFYKEKFNTYKGMCPIAEKAYESMFSIPIFPAMTIQDANRVCKAFETILQ